MTTGRPPIAPPRPVRAAPACALALTAVLAFGAATAGCSLARPAGDTAPRDPIEAYPATVPASTSAPAAASTTRSGSALPAGDQSMAAPLPPAGTRLYPSVAALLADPPPAGQTVWVDAFHGETIAIAPGWGRDATASGCPSAQGSPLLDKPFLLQLDAFGHVRASAPGPGDGPLLLAAGRDPDGRITAFPDLPRHGRLVLHLGDPAVAHCDDAERIALVERVAHAFEAKPDWVAMRTAIRRSATVGWFDGARDAVLPDGTLVPLSGSYSIAIPEGLQSADGATDPAQRDAAPPEGPAADFYADAALVQPDRPYDPILLRRFFRGEAGADDAETFAYDARQRALAERARVTIPSLATSAGLTFRVEEAREDNGRLTVRAITEADDVRFEIDVTLPADPIAAQPLLWRFEAVVDRFRVPGRDVGAPLAAAPSPTARPCPTRSVPVPLPTSTAYDEDDVMNDLMVTSLGWDTLPDAAVIVSATVGAIVSRTATLYDVPTPEPWPDGWSPVSGTPSPYYTLWQANTVEEVLKGGERVAVGDTVLIPYSDPERNAPHGAHSTVWWGVAPGKPGERYLFLLDDLPEPGTSSTTFLVYEEARPPGLAFALRGEAMGRLIVTYDRVRYSDADRLRTEFAQDMTGCAFLEQLRKAIRRAGDRR